MDSNTNIQDASSSGTPTPAPQQQRSSSSDSSRARTVGSVIKYNKILVPHDGTEMSDRALEHAIYLSKLSDSEIIILNVLEHLDNISPSALLAFMKRKGGGGETLGQEQQEQELRITMEGGVRQMIEEKLRLCREAGIKSQVSYKIQTGRPVNEIVKLAEEMEVDLIVMASSRISSSIRVLGSTTRKVMDSTKNPVLIIHE
jgi:nucleotide-binding universal stress UspA family protein